MFYCLVIVGNIIRLVTLIAQPCATLPVGGPNSNSTAYERKRRTKFHHFQSNSCMMTFAVVACTVGGTWALITFRDCLIGFSF